MLRGVEMMKTIYLTTIEEGYLGADNLLDAEVFCEMVNTIYLATTEEGYLGADNLLRLPGA